MSGHGNNGYYLFLQNNEKLIVNDKLKLSLTLLVRIDFVSNEKFTKVEQNIYHPFIFIPSIEISHLHKYMKKMTCYFIKKKSIDYVSANKF